MKTEEKDLIVVGAIAGAHGVRGEVRVRSFTEDPETLFDFGALLDRNGHTLLTPKSYRSGKNAFIVQPEEPGQKEYWDSLRGTDLCVPRAALPPAGTDEFYFEDLVGLRAIGPDGGALGIVSAVLNHGAGDLLEVRPADGSGSVLVPFTLADVPDIRLEEGTLILSDFALWSQAEED